MLPDNQARSIFVLKHTTSWRASEVSETVLGVDNAKSGICYVYICIYVCMYRLYVCPLNARGERFLLKLQSVRKFLRKRLLFKKQKVDSIGYYDIEDPLPDLNSKLRLFCGLSAACY